DEANGMKTAGLGMAHVTVQEPTRLSSAPAVSVSNLTKKFAAPGSQRQFTVLDGGSVRVNESNFVSIGGPSGCGKSTLLNIIAGIESYDGGSVTIAPRQGTAHHEPRIGYVFQSPRLLNWLTVTANIEFALEAQNVIKQSWHGLVSRYLGM